MSVVILRYTDRYQVKRFGAPRILFYAGRIFDLFQIAIDFLHEHLLLLGVLRLELDRVWSALTL
jgi:hypothetical protein